MAEVREQTEQTAQYRLTGPYGRIVYDADNKKSTLVEYKVGDMMTPTWDELQAHPDRFQAWPPSGTVLAEPKTPDETPPDETHRARSHR